MNKSALVIAAGVLLILSTGTISCSSEAEPEPAGPPNILFLFADDQRADTIGAWGNDHIKTPNIDRLVNQGFSFRNNYNLGSSGGAVCVPSRAMVNSGRYYFQVPNDLEGATLMPEVLGQNGYTTFATGKWHNQRPSWQRGFQQGNTIMFGGMSDHTKVPLVDLMPDGSFANEREEGFSSEIFANAAIDFISNYKDDKPFYAYIAFTAPHDPRQPPEEYREMYYEERPNMPRNFQPQHPFDIGRTMTGRDENLAGWPRKKEVVADQLAEYYGLITHLDEQIGRILKTLEGSPHANNTVIIYAADHGLAVGSHGLLGKQSVYEHSQRCPLIFSGPGIPKRQSSEAFTYLLDIFPTVATITGVTPPGNLDGHDLSAIWRDERQTVRDSVFLSFTDVSRSVRDEQYKLIRYPQIDHTQLFDLIADPDEMDNLAENPEQAEKIEELTALLKQWQEKVGDTQSLTVENPKPKMINLTGREREPDKWQPEWIIEKYF
jgi:arylsulfatase A-like enzyme